MKRMPVKYALEFLLALAGLDIFAEYLRVSYYI